MRPSSEPTLGRDDEINCARGDIACFIGELKAAESCARHMGDLYFAAVFMRAWQEMEALLAAYAVRGNRIAELTDALRTIADKQGKCLLGPENAECCELSYQTGSNAAFNDCAGEALSALRSPEESK